MRELIEDILYTDPQEETDQPVLAILCGSERSLMVDGGNSPRHAETFLGELSRHGLRAPDFIAITHAHCDHVFGLSSLNGIVIVNRLTNERLMELRQLRWDDDSVTARVNSGQEHEMTAHMLKLEMPGDRNGLKIRLPDLIYEKGLTVDLGNLICHIQWIGGDHAADSAVIYVPDRNVAFIGDCLYLRHTDPVTVRGLFEQLFSFPVDTYIDSHAVGPISRAELKERYRALGSA